MSAITTAEWDAFLTRAKLDQPLDVPVAPINAIRGRFIAELTVRLVKFWGEHRATLIPVLTQLAIATLDALTSAVTDIKAVDPPGPA